MAFVKQDIDPLDVASDGRERNGIQLIPTDEQEKRNYSARFNGRVQGRYSYFHDRGPFNNEALNELEIERARLSIRGFIFDDYLAYRFSTDWDSDDRTIGNLTNGWVQWDLQKAIGWGWGNKTNLRIGFWRTSFGRQRSESSRLLQFVDRSLTSTFFGIDRNMGIGLSGEFTHCYQPVVYQFVITNGLGSGTNSPRRDLDNNLGFVTRIHKTLIGDYEDESEADLGLASFHTLRIGFSTAYTRRSKQEITGARAEFDADPSVLIVTDVANGIPFFEMSDLTDEEEYDLFLAGVELDWKHAGWSFHTEYLMRSIHNVRFSGPETFSDFTHGYYVQGGYFLTEKVEWVARHSGLFASGRGNGAPLGTDYDTTAYATGTGLNFYFRGNHSKLQMDAFYYDGAPFNSGSMNIRGGDQGVMFRTQYQLSF